MVEKIQKYDLKHSFQPQPWKTFVFLFFCFDFVAFDPREMGFKHSERVDLCCLHLFGYGYVPQLFTPHVSHISIHDRRFRASALKPLTESFSLRKKVR